MASIVHSDPILWAFELLDTTVSNFILLLLKDSSFHEHACTKDLIKHLSHILHHARLHGIGLTILSSKSMLLPFENLPIRIMDGILMHYMPPRASCFRWISSWDGAFLGCIVSCGGGIQVYAGYSPGIYLDTQDPCDVVPVASRCLYMLSASRLRDCGWGWSVEVIVKWWCDQDLSLASLLIAPITFPPPYNLEGGWVGACQFARYIMAPVV